MTETEVGLGDDGAPKPRVGLALSGGGLRASFFHLGVLLQLARHDRLRDVEVISTVSGGSIIGVQLYLHLRSLLQEKPDDQIMREDYVGIVLSMREELRIVAHSNLRMRAFADLRRVIVMGSPYYSRTERIGELYDELLYRDLGGDVDEPILLRNLSISPSGKANFVQQSGNLTRRAKVPVILINATALNSGHNWRFSPYTMGEPPLGPTQEDLDRSTKLTRPDGYDDLEPGKRQGDFRLGWAVAASSCVPGLFFPMPVPDIYEDTNVQLVDGGVHDNQGVQGLIDEDGVKCDELIVSDGSGQMDWKSYPPTDVPHVLGRANSILMKRVRQEQLRDIGPATDDVLVHLRKGILVKELKPTPVPAAVGYEQALASESILHGGIPFRAEVQDHLAHMRTDLDSFTDIEADSLAVLGFAMAADELGTDPAPADPKPAWLMSAASTVANPSADSLRILSAGRSRWTRPMRMFWQRSHTIGAILTLVVVAGVVVGVRPLRESVWEGVSDGVRAAWDWHPQISLVRIVVIATIVGITLLFGRAAERWPWPANYLWWVTTFVVNTVRFFLMLVPLWIVVNIYLRTIDVWVLKKGKMPSSA